MRARSRINNIQGLRAFAALAVVVFHTGFHFPHLRAIGSFGVEIFFVISGYIMARICETDSSFFLRRRLIRILPPYWTATLLLFFLALRFPALVQATKASWLELLKSLLFIPFYKSNGLLRPLLFVGWSLNYEMFFYLAIAAGLFLVPKRPLLFASGLVLSVALCCHQLSTSNALAAFYGSAMMVEFVLGILAYEIARRLSQSFAYRTRALSLAVLIVSTLGIIWFRNLAPAGNPWGGPIVELLAMLMVLAVSLMSQGGWDTNLAWLILIGDASYVLYLVHPYCEYLISRVVTRTIPALDIGRPLGSAFAVAASVLLAILLHLTCERPAVAMLNLRFGGRRKSAEFSGAHAAPEQVAP